MFMDNSVKIYSGDGMDGRIDGQDFERGKK